MRGFYKDELETPIQHTFKDGRKNLFTYRVKHAISYLETDPTGSQRFRRGTVLQLARSGGGTLETTAATWVIPSLPE